MSEGSNGMQVKSETMVKDTPSEDSPVAIEIERKFVYSEDTEQKIKDFGGKLLKHCSIHDVYYDTPTYALTLSDHWLRCRNDQWELKCPPQQRQNDTMTQEYAEYADKTQIMDIVSKCLDISVVDKNWSIVDLLRESNCCSFASFRTDRKSYALDEFNIDLDEADFGFRVGEIEVVIVDKDRTASAISRINQLADKLGFHGEEQVGGKIDAYLIRNNKDHYQQLRRAHVLRSKAPEPAMQGP